MATTVRVRGAPAVRRLGFSIIELLVVIAVIGILFALATPSFRAWQDRATTQEAAVQLARGIDRARIDAKRTGDPVTVSADADEVVFRVDGVPIALPANVRIGSTSAVTFDPPFGTQEAAEVMFVVQSSRDAAVTRTLRVVGVLGKVVVE